MTCIVFKAPLNSNQPVSESCCVSDGCRSDVCWQRSERVVPSGRSLTVNSWERPLSTLTVTKPASKNLETSFSLRSFIFYPFIYLLVGAKKRFVVYC